MNDFIKGSLIATAVAGMFGCASQETPKAEMPAAAASSETVHCGGVNECKGQGKCHSADHGCAGQNECKGKGWIELSATDCAAKGGTVVP
jgi:hypothetical protein